MAQLVENYNDAFIYVIQVTPVNDMRRYCYSCLHLFFYFDVAGGQAFYDVGSLTSV